MEKPKNRRKTYKYFANFDIIKSNKNAQWFVRFPNEREHIFFGDERAKKFFDEVKELRKPQKQYAEEFESPIVSVSESITAHRAAEIARRLLASN